MTEFSYKNVKNASTGHILFEFHYGFHQQVSFKEDIDSYLKSCSTSKLAKELREQIEICCQNLLHA